MSEQNIYSNPEVYGLKILGRVERGWGYDYDMTVVFAGVHTGLLHIGDSSGCSCYSPFSYQDLSSLTPLPVEAAAFTLRDHLKARRTEGREQDQISQEIALVQQVSEYLSAPVYIPKHRA